MEILGQLLLAHALLSASMVGLLVGLLHSKKARKA